MALAALALDLGYFDQSHFIGDFIDRSHFIGDFTAQIGRSPGAHARACAAAAGRVHETALARG